MNNHFQKLSALIALAGLLLLALALASCSSQPDCAQTAKQARAQGKSCFRDGQTIYYMEK